MDYIEGKGRLRSISPPQTEYDVRYEFTIVQHMVHRPGFPPVPGNANSSGTVRSVDGDFIPEGVYELEMEERQKLRVTNVGLGEWCILANP